MATSQLGRSLSHVKKNLGNGNGFKSILLKNLPTSTLDANYGTGTGGSDRRALEYEELMNLITYDERLALIDVRTPQELRKYGSIPGAVNIPLNCVKSALKLSPDQFRKTFFVAKPEKDDHNLIFFARGPNASSAAVEIADRLGFKKSRHYSGGWEDYCTKTGLPLTKFGVGRKVDPESFDINFAF